MDLNACEGGRKCNGGGFNPDKSKTRNRQTRRNIRITGNKKMTEQDAQTFASGLLQPSALKCSGSRCEKPSRGLLL